MPGGRPLLFEKVEDLDAACEKYFESCWEEDWERKLKLDEKGVIVKPHEYEWIQQFDRQGNALLKMCKPYTITGLALALNTSRQTLLNYEERPEFFDTIKKAKDRCENYAEEGMFTGRIPAIPGIFNLKNNYAWVDKSEVDNNWRVVEMPTIKKDGKELKFNIGPGAKDEPGAAETT